MPSIQGGWAQIMSMQQHQKPKLLCSHLGMMARRRYSDKYENDFDTVVTFLSQYMNNRALTLSVKVASVGQSIPAKWQKTITISGTFMGKIELKKYPREKYDSMSMAQHQQLYEHWEKAGLIKGKTTPESSRALKARVAMLEAKQRMRAMRAYLLMKSPKLITEIIQCLTEREAEPDRAAKILDLGLLIADS